MSDKNMDAIVARFKNKKTKKRKDPDAAIKNMAVIYKKTVMESIYFLYVDDEDEWPIYIGRTKQTLKARLSKHLSESKTGNSKKCKALRTLQAEGFKINIMLIDEWPASEAGRAEDLAISNALGQGLKLLNTIENVGVDDYIVEIDENSKKSVWYPDILLEAEWVKGYKRAKSGEYGCDINGVEFYCKVKNVKKSFYFRFEHSIYGEWKIDSCVSPTHARQIIIDYFMPFTDSHKIMIEHMKKKA